MKQIILSLAIALSSIAATATETTVANNDVNQAFNKQFGHASEVKWSRSESYFKAEFVYNLQHLTAFYESDGTMIGVARNISSFDLPLNLQMSLRKEYSNRWITELVEMNTEAGTEYYVTMTNADTKLTLKANTATGWSSYKKTVKL